MTDTVSPPPLVEELVAEILQARNAFLKSQIHTSMKQDRLYLSNIHGCLRHNFYSLTHGDLRPPFNEHTQATLLSGNIWEKQIIKDLLDMGFEVVEGQVAVDIKHPKTGEIIARGRVDGKIRWRGQSIPYEVKSINQYAFDRINSVDDMFEQDWTQKYMRQILCYLLGNNIEQGLFILTDRANHWKVIPVFLGQHLDFAERTLQLIERAWEAKKAYEGGDANAVPERIAYHSRICGTCAFASTICLPEERIGGAEILDDPDTEAMLARHEEIKPVAAEYDVLHESVLALFRGKPQVTVGGRYVVIPKSRKGTRLNTKLLTDDERKRIQESTEIWTIKIDDISRDTSNAKEAHNTSI